MSYCHDASKLAGRGVLEEVLNFPSLVTVLHPPVKCKTLNLNACQLRCLWDLGMQ